MTKIWLKAGDQRPVPEIAVTDGDDRPIDLSFATAIFRMWELEATTPTIESGTATISDATGGLIQYAWGAGETDTPGQYVGEFVVTFQSGKTMTVPSRGFIEVEIQENLAAPPPPGP